MNISAVNAYNAQSFKSHYLNGRLMSSQGSDHMFPVDEPKTTKTQKTETEKEETSKEPEKVETTIHWMNYGDGHLIPVTVEIKK